MAQMVLIDYINIYTFLALLSKADNFPNKLSLIKQVRFQEF